MSIEIPKTNCKGCDARDRLIALMSAALDEASKALDLSASLMNTAADTISGPAAEHAAAEPRPAA